MKRKSNIYIISLLISAAFTVNLHAQKYNSVASGIHFYSEAPVEDIEAINQDGQSAINLSTGEIVFSIPIKAFIFEKSLMQEHFNENYLESEEYPRAIFKGVISGYDIEKTAWQQAIAQGKMVIHGIENDFSCKGKIKIENSALKIETKFPIQLNDYNIKIPKIVFYNIAEIIEVTINFDYEKIE